MNVYGAFHRIFLERRMHMTYSNQEIKYRVTLNTDTNLFVVYLANNDKVTASAATIEQAVQDLIKKNKE